MNPLILFCFFIPLCKLVAMPMVQLTLSCNIKELEQEFYHEYLPGYAAFYISTTNEASESMEFTDHEG